MLLLWFMSKIRSFFCCLTICPLCSFPQWRHFCSFLRYDPPFTFQENAIHFSFQRHDLHFLFERHALSVLFLRHVLLSSSLPLSAVLFFVFFYLRPWSTSDRQGRFDRKSWRWSLTSSLGRLMKGVWDDLRRTLTKWLHLSLGLDLFHGFMSPD